MNSPILQPAAAIAATFNCDPVIPLMADALSSIEVPHQVSATPYGQLAEQFLAADSVFARNTDGANAGLIRPADWFEHPGNPRGPERADTFTAARLVEISRRYARTGGFDLDVVHQERRGS